MRLRSVGSKACCKKLKLPKPIVNILSLRPCAEPPLKVFRFGFLANFLRINIYLTQKIGEDMLWNIAVNDAGAEYDPLTLLRTRTMFGRPDWNSIYSRMRGAIEGGNYLPGSKSQLKTKVAVRICIVSLSLVI